MPFLTIVIIALIVYVSIIGIGILWWMIIKNNRSISQTDDKKYILLEILVPKNNEKGPLAAESMFASMHGIFQEAIESQEKLSFEIAKILNPNQVTPTLVATDLDKFVIPDKGGLRKISLRENHLKVMVDFVGELSAS